MTANKHTPMVVAAARALCRRDSDLCNVDFDDNWKFYGDGFLMDAQVALESAAAPELLEALERIARPHDCGCKPCTSTCRNQIALEIAVEEMQDVARAAIAKATGGAA